MKNFIFDIDGTLIDTFDMYMPALMEILKDHGYRFADPAQLKKNLYGIAAVDALQQLNIPAGEIAVINREWLTRAYQRFDQVRLLAGIPVVIEQLAARPDTKLAIVTSKTRAEYQQYFQDQYQFAKNFTVVVTADDTAAHKPAPEPLLLAMHRLAVDPATTVYIGDMPTDMQAAHAAGICFAGAMYGAVHPEQLAPADYQLKTPADLLMI